MTFCQTEQPLHLKAGNEIPRIFTMASPLRSACRTARVTTEEKVVTSSLRADAPAFIPGGGFPVAEKKPKPSKALPPVASIKRMATKGCAIVMLRDRSVLELSVSMRVAVIDGVCVEVRRHCRKKESEAEEDTTTVGGVFVAWGHRVARRVDVSELGIEAYFNGLAAVDEPEDIEADAPFEEELQYFELKSKGPLRLEAPSADTANVEQMLNGPHGRPELVKDLWEAKERLEEIWQKPPPPMGRSLMQRVARDQLFPHSGKEGEKHENRAGEKLEELALAVGLLDDVKSGSGFLDLCGGPGAWSQYLLSKSDLALRGFGFTLRSGSGSEEDWQSQEKDDWYPELLEDARWTALWGADGTGDLLKPSNLTHSTKELKKRGGVFLCVADGGFSDKAIPANLLELYFYRLFLAELLMAVECLQPGGRFVCKLYTSCSAATSALLFLVTRLFEKTAIVKPMTSRVSGPERYLYASGFRIGAETESIREALQRCQDFGAGASPLQAPLLTPLVASSELSKDESFLKQLQNMVATLLERQAGSLNAILERAERLEEIALDAAREASAGAVRWAEAAAEQREANAALATRSEERPRRYEAGDGYESRRRENRSERSGRDDRSSARRYPQAKYFS
jgi:23S rRNA U2552 (ribose-2'-O)-methylase RlmE/FtsJ